MARTVAAREPIVAGSLMRRQLLGGWAGPDLTRGLACGEVGALFATPRLMRSVNGEGLGETVGLGAREEQGEREGIVSLRAEVPEALLAAMRDFIDRHPSWDQYRLVQAALAGFLVQHGSQDRDVTRCYLSNLFPGHRSFAGAPSPEPAPWVPSQRAA
ncbi:MAG: hypothetical protein RLZZ117_1465 [Cyanobacteriota bacterium]